VESQINCIVYVPHLYSKTSVDVCENLYIYNASVCGSQLLKCIASTLELCVIPANHVFMKSPEKCYGVRCVDYGCWDQSYTKYGKRELEFGYEKAACTVFPRKSGL
jgi:hypothetical protein